MGVRQKYREGKTRIDAQNTQIGKVDVLEHSRFAAFKHLLSFRLLLPTPHP